MTLSLEACRERQAALVEVALAEARKNVREVGGANRGADVERYQKAVDGKAQGEPWCVGMAQWCVREVDRRYLLTDPGTTSHVLYPTEHVLTLWRHAPQHLRCRTPEPGMLIAWQHVRASGPAATGHIGIVVELLAGDEIRTVEGNTSPGPGAAVVREGDGVYVKTRSLKGMPTMRVLGFIRPWDPGPQALA